MPGLQQRGGAERPFRVSPRGPPFLARSPAASATSAARLERGPRPQHSLSSPAPSPRFPGSRSPPHPRSGPAGLRELQLPGSEEHDEVRSALDPVREHVGRIQVLGVRVLLDPAIRLHLLGPSTLARSK